MITECTCVSVAVQSGLKRKTVKLRREDDVLSESRNFDQNDLLVIASSNERKWWYLLFN